MTKRKRTKSSRNNEQTRFKFFERFGSTKSKSSVVGFVMKVPSIFLTKRAVLLVLSRLVHFIICIEE
jgi:hypothetical protein